VADAAAGDDVTQLEKTGSGGDDTRVHLMPVYLVVCAWRSIKEVSLLLGQLTSTVPVIDPGGEVSNEVTDCSNEVTMEQSVRTAETSGGLLTVDLVSHRPLASSKLYCLLTEAFILNST